MGLDPEAVVSEFLSLHPEFSYVTPQVEELEAVNNPEDPSAGTRRLPFSRELYIEQEDFKENPPKGDGMMRLDSREES